MQSFLRTSAAGGREVVEVPPFTAYLDGSDPLKYLNYAVPDGDAQPSADDIARLREAFRARERLPRLEWIEEFAPRVAAALAAAGMREELRSPLMACAPDDLVEASADVPDLSVRPAAAEDLRDVTNIQRVSFGQPPLPADDEPPRPSGGKVVALAGTEPVAGGAWTAVIDGVSEIVGVATDEAWRRHGLAGAVTAACARGAFEAGASLCVLSPGDATAQRVYERAGFRGIATMLHWSDERGA